MNASWAYIGTEMEKEQTMQQIIEMLAEIKADRKADQANAKSNKEAMLVKFKAKIDENQERMEAKMDANQAKAAKQEEMLAEISARMNANLKDLKEDIKSGQVQMRSTICAFRSQLKIIQHEMKAVIQPMRSELDETTACKGAKANKPDPGMMQSIGEHQEIPIGGPRKRRRVRNLAAERRQKWRERTRGYRGSGRSWLPPAGRCPAVQKWHGEKETSSGKFGPWKSVDGERSSPPPK
jgi:DNA repair exonuclease SbcCD ATPase subunit